MPQLSGIGGLVCNDLGNLLPGELNDVKDGEILGEDGRRRQPLGAAEDNDVGACVQDTQGAAFLANMQ